MPITRSPLIMLRIFLPFAAGYFISYLYRVVNAVISPDLVSELALNPSSLGLLTAAYFISFAAAQLPLGVLLDRFGPRRIEGLLLLVAAMGAWWFSRAHDLTGLIIGRALIGFGVSACLMAAFTAFVTWFPRHRLPLVNGIQMAAGGMGALAATAPVEALLTVTDWRGLFGGLAVTTAAVGIAVFVVVPKKPPAASGASLKESAAGIAAVFSDARFWRITPVTVMSQAAFLSIQGLWAGPWLRDVMGLERMAAAKILLLVAVAMVAGFLTLGMVSSRVNRSGQRPHSAPVGGMLLFMTVQALLLLRPPLPAAVQWMAFGFFGTSGILSYAALSQQFPPALAGRVNTGINLLVFVAAFICQWGIGAIIQWWPHRAAGVYATEGYLAAFGVMLALQAAAMIWFWVSGRRGG
ncbi:MAG: MFS transporter [Pseudomonadota bacterium]